MMNLRLLMHHQKYLTNYFILGKVFMRATALIFHFLYHVFLKGAMPFIWKNENDFNQVVLDQNMRSLRQHEKQQQ